MRIDENGVLVSEIWRDTDRAGWCANRGDSLANTSRWCLLLNEQRNCLPGFRTGEGYLRHPSPMMPDAWKETDIPTDQLLPYFLASHKDYQTEIILRIKHNGWRTGNGDYVSPMFWAVLHNQRWALNIALIAQLAIFSIPIRWSDSKKWFESSKDSTADVLNWFHCLPLASQWVRRQVNKDHARQKIHAYYSNEPNSGWLLDLYDQAIEKVLG